MVYGIFASVYGALMTLQNLLCAQLGTAYGNWFSTLTVHLVGLVILTPVFLAAWRKQFTRVPWYYCLGGVLGVVPVICSNYSIVLLGLTNSSILSLLAEISASVLLDALGWLGSRKRRVTGLKLAALAVIFAGCAAMALISGSLGHALPLAAVLVSIVRGAALVCARKVNGMLAERTGTGFSTWMNYATGLAASALIFALLRFPMNIPFPSAEVPIYAYLGGVLGCAGIFLANKATPRLSALNLAVIVFVSKTAVSLLLDALLKGVSPATLAGCLIVAVGMVINLLAEKNDAAKAA